MSGLYQPILLSVKEQKQKQNEAKTKQRILVSNVKYQSIYHLWHTFSLAVLKPVFYTCQIWVIIYHNV